MICKVALLGALASSLIGGSAQASGTAKAQRGLARWAPALRARRQGCAPVAKSCSGERRLLRAVRRQAQAHHHRARRAARPALAIPGSIEGTVTDAGTKSGVKGIEVCALPFAAPEEEPLGEEVCAPNTTASGEYVLGELPPGEYLVGFFDPTGNYVTEYWDHATGSEEPTPVLVSAGTATQGIDAALREAGTIEGTITAAAEPGQPLEWLFVCAEDPPRGAGCAITDAGGHYRIRGLLPGSYKVQVFVPPLPGENYLRATVENVSVLPKAIAVRDFALATGGIITGRVTSEATGEGLSGIQVCALGPAEPECAYTSSGGFYALERLETGSYVVGFRGEPFLIQYYPGKLRRYEAAPVFVRAGDEVAGIDAAMFTTVLQPPPAGGVPVTPPIGAPALAPSSSVLPSKTVVPSITVAGRVHIAGRLGTVKLHCAVGPCHGTLQLLVSVVRRHRAGGHTVTRHVTLLLGSGGFSLAQGASGKATIHLNSTGRRMLAAAAKHPRAARLKLAMQGVPGTMHAVIAG